ncbi:MAG: transposase, partial [Acidobacteriota bacterium]
SGAFGSRQKFLDRLRLVIENLPDEDLMEKLEKQRGRGRDDYPVRAIWNSILAGVVFQHGSVESLGRELERNGQLRDLCGFDPFAGAEAVPSWTPTAVF